MKIDPQIHNYTVESLACSCNYSFVLSMKQLANADKGFVPVVATALVCSALLQPTAQLDNSSSTLNGLEDQSDTKAAKAIRAMSKRKYPEKEDTGYNATSHRVKL